MTPEELEAMKAQIDALNMCGGFETTPTARGVQLTPEQLEAARLQSESLNRRDPGLVRAELVDALRDYAEIFREKAAQEHRRADAVDVVARKVAEGGSAEQLDIAQSFAFEREQGLLHMRFQELQMRVNRLILEHGNG